MAKRDASSSNKTLFSDTVNPQVLTQMVSAQLAKANVFSSIAPVDATLQGKPGDTVTVPKWEFTGSAKEVAEGAQIDFDSLSYKTQTAKIKKAVSAFAITDEAQLSGYGDSKTEAAHQMALAIETKLDDDILATALTAPLTVSVTPDKVDVIDALEDAFAGATNAVEGSTYPQQGVLYVSYKDAAALRKAAGQDWTRASDLGDNILVNGAFGELLGWEIVRTAKLNKGQAIAVKPGALKTYIKELPIVEVWRDQDHQIDKSSTTEYYAIAIANDALVAQIGGTASAASTGR
ncbi:phage major capsid protein [Limosilactobacillus gorillae]|uniref:phage major capsid protein n=1 Tax=Limosilactobacillus gorillae TaxID=1450649 RepID=UPI000B211399|nr:head protein [Limosilactobacillus gorillae]